MADKKSLDELRRDVSALRDCLASTRKAINGQPVVIPSDGELKPNPAWHEFERMLKEYRLALKDLDTLEAGKKQPISASKLGDMKDKFRLVV